MTDTDHRLANFCAGPASIPTAVLQKAQTEMLNWHNKGLSVMEMSHRSADYMVIAERAENQLRKLLNIPQDYQVLFLQGGASLQFSAIPLNFLQGTADYLVTGAWSEKALKEAQRYEKLSLGKINLVASSQNNRFTQPPSKDDWQVSQNADYFHYCANETIHGVQIFDPPKVNAPLIADMSSCILSEPIDVSQYAMIYAGAQKNIGPAGLVIAIIHETLLNKSANPWCPTLMNYRHQADKHSMSNTPPTYAWYLAGLVFDWLIDQGGLSQIQKINQQKAKLLYDTLDQSDFYQNSVDPKYRSIMNIPFTLADSALDKTFLQQAEAQGLLNLKGHRDVGGMRASLYNAISLEDVKKLTTFMKEFEKQFT